MNASTQQRAGAVLLATLVSVLPGCSLDRQRPDFGSIDPQERVLAVVAAADSGGADDLPRLVSRLESSDPAERMLSILILERRTGERFGYDHSDPEYKRRASINRWKEWLASADADTSARAARDTPETVR